MRLVVYIAAGFLINKADDNTLLFRNDIVKSEFRNHRNEFQKGLQSGRFFILKFSCLSKPYTIAGLPIKNLKGKIAGYLITAGSFGAREDHGRVYILVAALLVGILTIFAVFVFYIIRTKAYFEYLETYDSLTGAFKKVAFEEFFEREIGKCAGITVHYL